jgi:hypothetical protein
VLIVGGNQSAGGFEVANSCRFEGAKMYHTFGSTSNRKTYTVSGWLKKSANTEQSFVFAGDLSGAHPYFDARFDNSTGIINWYHADSLGNQAFNLKTSRSFRDPSAWYHIILAVDTTQATSSNRLKIYVNGVQETSFSTASYPSLNFDTAFNVSGYEAQYGAVRVNTPNYKGYMSELILIDGQALDPTSFGEFDEDTGIWKPIDVSGLTFGTNGYYLQFQDSAALGDDTSGNNNDFTLSGISSIDQTTDTPTNNYATLNYNLPLFSSSFSEGNCKWTPTTGSQYYWVNSTIGLSQGKWYMEAKLTTAAAHNGIGISSDKPADSTTYFAGSGGSGDANDAYQWNYLSSDGRIYNNASSSAYGATYTTGDILGLYLDLDNNKLYFAKNGTVQNSGTGVSITDPGSVPTGVYFPCVADDTASNSSVWEVNFGNPSYTISSGNSDPNGYGNFEYDPSAGTFDGVSKNFYALNTKNLAEYG